MMNEDEITRLLAELDVMLARSMAALIITGAGGVTVTREADVFTVSA